MDLDKLKSALNVAESGLADADRRVRAIQEHKDRLQGVVKSLRTLLEAEANENNLIAYVGTKEQRRPSKANPTWSKVVHALKELDAPATVPQIFEHMSKWGTPPAGDAIRIAILRKPDVFIKYGKARYGLRELHKHYPALHTEEAGMQVEGATEVAP